MDNEDMALPELPGGLCAVFTDELDLQWVCEYMKS